MSFLINPFVFESAAAATLNDLLDADATTYGGVYYRLDETSGTTVNDDGSWGNATYIGSPSLNQTAIYTGGPVCVRYNTSNTNAVNLNTSSVGAMTNVTLGCVVQIASISGIRHFWSRDVDAGTRHFQWRLNGSNMEWVKIQGGVQTVSAAHGMSNGTTHMVVVSISSGGSVKLFVDGAQIGSTGSITGVDYGSASTTDLILGNRDGANNTEAQDIYYSEAFVFPTVISDSRIADYATAAGL